MHGAVAHVFGAPQLGKQLALALQQIPGFTEFPRAQGIVDEHAQAEAELAVSAQARPPVRHERRLALVRIEGHEDVYRAVHDGEYAGIVAGIVAVEQLQIFDRGGERRVVEIMHAQRRVAPHAQRGFGDHAELAVAEDHPLEQLGVVRVGALDDVPSGRDHLQRQRLVGAAAEARRVHIDAAHAQCAADRGGEVQRRR